MNAFLRNKPTLEVLEPVVAWDPPPVYVSGYSKLRDGWDCAPLALLLQWRHLMFTHQQAEKAAGRARERAAACMSWGTRCGHSPAHQTLAPSIPCSHTRTLAVTSLFHLYILAFDTETLISRPCTEPTKGNGGTGGGAGVPPRACGGRRRRRPTRRARTEPWPTSRRWRAWPLSPCASTWPCLRPRWGSHVLLVAPRALMHNNMQQAGNKLFDTLPVLLLPKLRGVSNTRTVRHSQSVNFAFAVSTMVGRV